MPRLPTGVEPYHPVQDYDLRVGVLRHQEAGEPIGHVLVECRVYWPHLGGLLWWRRWGEPDQTAVAILQLHGRFDDWFIRGDELEAALHEWNRNRFVWHDRDAGRRDYQVSWLSSEESVGVAQRELGVDVGELRRERKR